MVRAVRRPAGGVPEGRAESYRLWLTYELRTDDITIICVHFKFSGEALPKRDPRAQSERALEKQLRRRAPRHVQGEAARAAAQGHGGAREGGGPPRTA
ncbi:hypothetical protein PINS_up015398 [Pythium insidiosum]|nr:hypothetical protein PINS_up015398 [Pythium insidiosum]